MCRNTIVLNFSLVIIFLTAVLSIGLLVNNDSSGTITNEATSTPMLLLPPQDLETVQSLTQMTSKCRLPCFWGFTPNETTANDIIEFTNAQPPTDWETIELAYDFIATDYITTDGEEPHLSIFFIIDKNYLQYMHGSIAQPKYFLMPNTLQIDALLKQMPSTPEIFLLINQTTRIFSLTLIYNDLGVMAQYVYLFREDEFLPFTDEKILLCPRIEQNRSIHFWLQDPSSAHLTEDLIYPSGPSGILRNNETPIENAGDFTSQEFINQIIASPDECIEIYSFNTLQEQGMSFP